MVIHTSGQNWYFWCPGCKTNHRFSADRWQFNGDVDKPTFTPSLITDPDGSYHCHLTITDGVIQYHGDCNHDMKGQKVKMTEEGEHFHD